MFHTTPQASRWSDAAIFFVFLCHVHSGLKKSKGLHAKKLGPQERRPSLWKPFDYVFGKIKSGRKSFWRETILNLFHFLPWKMRHCTSRISIYSSTNFSFYLCFMFYENICWMLVIRILGLVVSLFFKKRRRIQLRKKIYNSVALISIFLIFFFCNEFNFIWKTKMCDKKVKKYYESARIVVQMLIY